MSLKQIRSRLAARIGKNVSNPTQKAFLDTVLINEAAEELYNYPDLANITAEEIVYFNVATKQVTLPERMFNIRKMRYYDTKYQVGVSSIHPHYGYDGWGKETLQFRDKYYTPLTKSLTNFSRLTFSLDLKEDVDVVITLRGRTSNAAQAYEKLIIPTGQLSVMSEHDYEDITDIGKEDYNQYNIHVTDVDGNEVSVIPNNETRAVYKVVQVLDDNIAFAIDGSAVEVLYRKKFYRLINDGDQFLGFDTYDTAIYWKAMENWYATQTNGMNDALAARAKCDKLISDIFDVQEAGIEKPMDFAPNPFYGMFREMKTIYGSKDLGK